MEQYRDMGRRLGRLLYEGRWFDPQSLMIHEPCSAGWRAPSPAGHPRTAARHDYSILDTQSPDLTYNPERLTMEKHEGAFTAQDRHRPTHHAQSRHHRQPR